MTPRPTAYVDRSSPTPPPVAPAIPTEAEQASGATGAAPGARRRFRRIAAAGITFQGGSAAADSGTIVAGLVHQLTGSAVAVGAVTAILRIGWLLPPLWVGYLAGRRGRSLPYFRLGAFARGGWLVLLGGLLAVAGALPPIAVVFGFFVLWTAYAFSSGIVAVPYNDIVARSVPSERRSRLLAVRFFGGGLLALLVAAGADRLLGGLEFPASYAAIVALAGALMLVSAGLFTSLGEPPGAPSRRSAATFRAYLGEGVAVWREDRAFRRFVYAQWCGGAAMMALPFYVVHAFGQGVAPGDVAWLLAAQVAGALASNALWGWWGDARGKASLMRGVALLRLVPPAAALLVSVLGPSSASAVTATFAGLFFVLGALTNGVTIAVIGYLMEISPDERRPAYSGYFNAITAPAYLLALAGGVLAETVSLEAVFVIAMAAAAGQYVALRRDSSTRSRA